MSDVRKKGEPFWWTDLPTWTRNLRQRFPDVKRGQARSVYYGAKFKSGYREGVWHGVITTFGTVNCEITLDTPEPSGRRTWKVRSVHIIDIV